MNRLPRPVKLFGAVSLLNDFASEMVYPLLPALVTTTLGAGSIALGALDGAADFASSVAKYRAGRLADRPAARGPLIVAGYAVAVLVRPVIALAAAVWQVIGLRVADRLGKGVRTPPRDAMIADATSLELRGRAFGFQRGLDHVGAVLGPLAAWLLLTGGWDLRAVIGASLIPGVAVLVLAVWAVRDGRRSRLVEVGGGAGGDIAPGATSTIVPQPPPSSPILLLSAFHLLRMPEAIVILWVQQLGVSLAQVTLLWAGLHVVKAGSSFWGGTLADRVGAGRTLAVGWAGYCLLASGCALAHGPSQAWGLFLALGVAAGLTEGPERVLVARLGGRRQGSAFGAYHAATGIAALAGGLALGAIYATRGHTVAFGASAFGCGLLLVAAALVLRDGKSR